MVNVLDPIQFHICVAQLADEYVVVVILHVYLLTLYKIVTLMMKFDCMNCKTVLKYTNRPL